MELQRSLQTLKKKQIEQEDDDEDLDQDLDEEDYPPPPPKKITKINNAPVYPYNDPKVMEDPVNPFQPIAAAPVKLPPVSKLPPPKAMAFDFSGGAQGTPGPQK